MALREAKLEQQLAPDTVLVPERDQIPDDPDAEEVARLKALLSGYYTAQAAATAASADNPSDGGIELADADSLAGKIRLTGPEGIAVIGQISQSTGRAADHRATDHDRCRRAIGAVNDCRFGWAAYEPGRQGSGDLVSRNARSAPRGS